MLRASTSMLVGMPWKSRLLVSFGQSSTNYASRTVKSWRHSLRPTREGRVAMVAVIFHGQSWNWRAFLRKHSKKAVPGARSSSLMLLMSAANKAYAKPSTSLIGLHKPHWKAKSCSTSASQADIIRQSGFPTAQKSLSRRTMTLISQHTSETSCVLSPLARETKHMRSKRSWRKWRQVFFSGSFWWWSLLCEISIPDNA